MRSVLIKPPGYLQGPGFGLWTTLPIGLECATISAMQIGHPGRGVMLGLLCVAVALPGCGGSSKTGRTVTPTPTFSDPRGTGSPASSAAVVATTGPNVRPGEKPPVLLQVAKSNQPAGALGFATY